MYPFKQIFKRDLLNLFLNPMWFFYGTVFPFLLVLILGFLSSGNYGDSITSYDYYGITMMIYIVFNTSTIAANSFMEERIKKGNMRIIYSPVPKSYIYLSKITASFVFSSVCHLFVIMLLHVLLKIHLGGSNTGFTLSILIMFEAFASVLGVLCCCIFKSENTSNQILSMVINISALLGGLFFRMDGFGSSIEKISYLSPVKWIVINMFKIIYDNDFSYYLPTALILLSLSVAALLLCGKFYRTEDYIG
ncbi:transport permease protein [Siminovitchia terrae]|uniref:ABC transporter permease n=1 Tax=Siminovitchia terrae TaxID=1914933 RepID=A0A429X8M2_SIMTE|nr:ABC transporter permease [Siminovitchia terrae]RST59798.1 ABC transporter permease [Siminovitchia terrae]GIN91695.1 transport permease protein [Siminovitchia terrae]GIN95783.1 transport permease protein [Siminovitchia terrae]